jgi:hypothetical protein
MLHAAIGLLAERTYFSRCVLPVCCFIHWQMFHPRLEMSFTYVQLFVAFLLSAIVFRLLQGRQQRRIPYPPGPKGHPLIGNLRDLPTRYQWLKYEEWGKDFGKHHY